MQYRSLPYLPDPLPFYADCITRPYGFALTGGRYTIIGWDPVEVITGGEDPFARMEASLASNSTHSPCTGWYGYLGYELGERFHPHLNSRTRDLPLPDLCMGLYDQLAVYDHQNKEAYGWGTIAESASRTESFSVRSFRSNFTPKAYQAAFHQAQEALKRGDVYQVNLAQRFTADFEGSSWAYFLSLLKINPAPFSAYFQLPEAAILSCSPERFIRINNKLIETKPIKGTCPLDQDPIEKLLKSEKNRAENLMIVDLMRNDLGQICEAGTITVPELFTIESYRSVHHLVSTVCGQLKPEVSPLDALRACFPGGSITGAPKLAAMQQIRNLEPHARQVYCGSIGYLDSSGTLDMNIAIRTLVITEGQCHVWAGGGIVLDSSWESEYQECYDKIRPILGAQDAAGD